MPQVISTQMIDIDTKKTLEQIQTIVDGLGMFKKCKIKKNELVARDSLMTKMELRVKDTGDSRVGYVRAMEAKIVDAKIVAKKING